MMEKFVLGAVLVSAFIQGVNATELTVQRIDVKERGNVSVYFTNPTSVPPGPTNCAHKGTVSWEGSDPSSDNYLSAFLAAHMGKRKVEVIVDTKTETGCLWSGWPRLLTVRVL
jgi:hypothetical protein